MKRIIYVIIIFIFDFYTSYGQIIEPKPCGPIPNENQMRWQEMECYAFVHFSVNTYTDKSWGSGDESPEIFNPQKLDCRQWARVCKNAGMKGIIITAKHHSGFCLWPSKYTEYSVKNCPWKNGKGDIVGELAQACKEFGLKLGIYLSPWDRNSAVYGKPEYITYFRNQLKELLTKYGDIFEIWFDGANGGTGYYGGARENRKIDKTIYYDWKNTYKLIRELQPNIVIWNDGGDRGDLRWVGTEAGYVGETNWSLLNATGDVTWDMLHHGLENGNAWVPAEVNTSIRPEWFYHPSENTKVKTLPQLLDTYYNSVGRNAALLLNFPIDKDGLIYSADEKAGFEFAKTVKEIFKVNLAENKKTFATNVRGKSQRYSPDKAVDNNKNSYWCTDDSVKAASITIDLGKPLEFNRFLVQEYIRLGQRVKSFSIEALVGGKWEKIACATTIGYKRILSFPMVRSSKIRLNIIDSKACPLISNVGIYKAPMVLTAPFITRNQMGDITISAADKNSEIYYTLNGSLPTFKSKKYLGEIGTDGKIEVRAITYDSETHKSSIITSEKFDVSKKMWKIISTSDPKASAVLDGNPNTSWYCKSENKEQTDLIIDLGKTETLTGFKYLPGQTRDRGIISNYEFWVSNDKTSWKLVDKGEFSNIKNNPLWQVKTFSPVLAHFVKFHSLGNVQDDNETGYSEFDIITK